MSDIFAAKKSDDERPADEWRIKNLQRLLEFLSENRDEQIEILGKAVSSFSGKPEDGVVQHLKKVMTKKIPFGDKWADYVEKALGDLEVSYPVLKGYVSRGVLDYPPELDSIAYVMASVDVQRWDLIIANLKKIPEVKEVALILGRSDADALIKIEAPAKKLTDLLINQIARNPLIQKTQTLQSVQYSQWQREQKARKDELEQLSFIKSAQSDSSEVFELSTHFPSEDIERIFRREVGYKKRTIDEIQGGRIVIKREAEINLFPDYIVKAAKLYIKAVVNWGKIGIGELDRIKRYMTAQYNKKNKNPYFDISRIFLLDRPEELFTTNKALRERLGCELEIGINVRYLDRWPNIRIGEKDVDFGIIDKSASWKMLEVFNREHLRHIDLTVIVSEVERAISDFDMLWYSAKDISEDLNRQFREDYLNSEWVNFVPPRT